MRGTNARYFKASDLKIKVHLHLYIFFRFHHWHHSKRGRIFEKIQWSLRVHCGFFELMRLVRTHSSTSGLETDKEVGFTLGKADEKCCWKRFRKECTLKGRPHSRNFISLSNRFCFYMVPEKNPGNRSISSSQLVKVKSAIPDI